MTENSRSGSDVKKQKLKGSAVFLSSALCLLIFVYRHSLSYFIGQQCRFVPTCSAYAHDVIRLHGPIEGTTLAIKRFCRCHPWGSEDGGQESEIR